MEPIDMNQNMPGIHFNTPRGLAPVLSKQAQGVHAALSLGIDPDILVGENETGAVAQKVQSLRQQLTAEPLIRPDQVEQARAFLESGKWNDPTVWRSLSEQMARAFEPSI